MNTKYIEAPLIKFIEFNAIGFFYDIFQKKYIWQILEFEYVPYNNFWATNKMNDEISFIFNELKKNANNRCAKPLSISWDSLVLMLKSSSQIINTFIYVFNNNNKLL